jgi:limonene-1,2-epoxide hydrolase
VFDPALNVTYWGTGNPAPWVADNRPGDNLYTDSTLALDVETGQLKSYHQVSAAGLVLLGALRSANKIDQRRSQMESPIQVVRRFCAAWSDDVGAAELAAFFSDNAVYHNIPLAPVTGRQAIANNIATFIRPGAPGIESLALRLINIVAEGPIVMTERVDVFKVPNKSFELQVMGIFEVRDGKIDAWRDYFDMNQFTTRMG